MTCARSGHLYVATKLAAEMLMHSYQEMYGQEFTILRYGIPYGPRMRDALVVARFVRAARNGEPITIAGTGEQQRNFVYVEDLADAHVLTLTPAAANQTLALEGDTPVSVNEIAETVQHLVRPVPIRHVSGRAADYDGIPISNRLAKELLNWSPTTPLAEGIRRYLAWLGNPAGWPVTVRPPVASGRRALLLSGSIGMGHDTLAEACSAMLVTDGWSARDPGPDATARPRCRFGRRRGVPVDARGARRLYDAFHFAALRTGGRLADLADAAARRQVLPRLRARLDASPAELVRVGVRHRSLGDQPGSPRAIPRPGTSCSAPMRPRTGCGCTRTWTCTWSPRR